MRLDLGQKAWDFFRRLKAGTVTIPVSTHALNHVAGGSDEINGDAVELNRATTNYVAAGSTIAQHLAGIDTVLGTVLALPLFASYAFYRDQGASGTAGPSYTSGAFRQVRLTTEVADPDSIGSIASNQVTLGAGSYLAIWVIPQPLSNAVQSQLFNATDTTTISPGFSGANAGGVAMPSIGFASFTLAGSKAIELQIRVAVTGAATAVSFGIPEVYAQLLFLKLA